MGGMDRDILAKLIGEKVQIVNNKHFVLIGVIKEVFGSSAGILTDGNIRYICFDCVKEIRPIDLITFINELLKKLNKKKDRGKKEMACIETIAMGVRIPKDLYESIKEDDPGFNLSKFVTAALVKRYESIEDKVDRVLKQKGVM